MKLSNTVSMTYCWESEENLSMSLGKMSDESTHWMKQWDRSNVTLQVTAICTIVISHTICRHKTDKTQATSQIHFWKITFGCQFIFVLKFRTVMAELKEIKTEVCCLRNHATFYVNVFATFELHSEPSAECIPIESYSK